MIVPAFLLMLSVAGVVLSVIAPGWSDLVLLAGPCALASAVLLLRAYLRGRADARREWAVLDGSNVMHWKDGAPRIATVREVVDHLSAHGLTPCVVFDANVGYKVGDRYMGDRALAALLGLPRKRVMVVPKGEPADPTILRAARNVKARIVTNDRFRDWEETFPEACDSGRLVRGGYRGRKLWLDLPARP